MELVNVPPLSLISIRPLKYVRFALAKHQSGTEKFVKPAPQEVSLVINMKTVLLVLQTVIGVHKSKNA